MTLIYHIAPADQWAGAQAAGQVVADSLATEGFIHCSRQDQLLAVADRFFGGQQNLVVLAIDEASVAPWLVYEGAMGEDDPFAREVFPHLYAPLPLSAVISVAPLTAGADGRFVWPEELPYA